MEKYIVCRMRDRILSFLLDEGGHALEIHADPETAGLQLGDICVGRVQKVRRDLNAAFVDVSPGLTCYLPLEEAREPVLVSGSRDRDLQQGDQLLVQISREAMKTKNPALTARISLQGSYCVTGLTGGARAMPAVSRKLSEPDRARLRELAEPFCGSYSVLIRTNAASVPEETVTGEIRRLQERLNRIRETAPHRTCYSVIYRQPGAWLRRFASLSLERTEKIVTGDRDLMDQAAAFLEERESLLADRLSLYEDSMVPIRALYSLERELDQALARRVWLKSGAYLVIEPTEALVAVDVNSGKAAAAGRTGKDREAFLLETDLEAAEELCRQLRLRSLSGIILVDFINLDREEDRKILMDRLRVLLARDPVQAHLIDMTRLNLIEITRKKTERPLHEAFLPQGRD